MAGGTDEQPAVPEDVLRAAERVVRCLGPVTSSDRGKWIRVGIYLKALLRGHACEVGGGASQAQLRCTSDRALFEV